MTHDPYNMTCEEFQAQMPELIGSGEDVGCPSPRAELRPLPGPPLRPRDHRRGRPPALSRSKTRRTTSGNRSSPPSSRRMNRAEANPCRSSCSIRIREGNPNGTSLRSSPSTTLPQPSAALTLPWAWPIMHWGSRSRRPTAAKNRLVACGNRPAPSGIGITGAQWIVSTGTDALQDWDVRVCQRGTDNA